MVEEILQTVSYTQEEPSASFPPLCKNTDMPHEECDCEECRPTKDAPDGATPSAEVDPIIKAINGMLDACVQPPRR